MKFSKDKLSPDNINGDVLELTNTSKLSREVAELTKKLADLIVSFGQLENKVDGFDTEINTTEINADVANIVDAFITNAAADVFNSDKHSFKTGETGSHLSMQPGTIIYAHGENTYALMIWVNENAYICVTPNQYLWSVARDYSFGLASGAEFSYSYIGTGCSDITSTVGSLRLLNSGITLKGNLNAEYTGTTEFADGIIVDYLLQVEGNTFITGDIDIGGDIDIEGNINSNGDITTQGTLTAEGNVDVTGNISAQGNITIQGNIYQQGEAYETHAEKIYSKKDLIITRDGAVSGLGANEVTGIQAKKYDGTNDGQLVFGADGVARVGDVGDLQSIATREDNPTDGAAAVWNDSEKRFDSKTIDTVPTVDSLNLINSNAVARVGRYFSTSCSTSASEQIKEITIKNLTLVNGDIIGVTFSNENSYGDCTLTTPTYPTLKLNSGSALPICDSLGHTVGKGCWNSGDYIELRYCGDKFIIINSDIRQCVNGESGYVIQSNNFCKQWGTISSGGNTNITINVLYKNTNYSVVITSLGAGTGYTTTGSEVLRYKNSTNFIVGTMYSKTTYICEGFIS